ncbi:MAG: hypothetical protein ACRD1U_05995, partial [Vicinamibacterales bacterium]
VLLPLIGAACSSHPTTPSSSLPTAAGSSAATAEGGRAAATGVVYVSSQGLYYDTFVARDPLPMAGKFQLLVNGRTEFGPGQPGYLGGRWWEDLNGNGTQDAGDHFFLCPLLPPGRPTP